MTQKQNVQGGSLAIQADGNVNLQLGAGGAELAALLSEFASTLLNLHAEGQAKADERLKLFRDEVLRKFEDSKVADPRAFKDLDFQYALQKAQQNFVRADGDDLVAESLVNLLTERSRYSGRSRVSLCINNAIDVVGNLTGEEISAITAVFIVKRTVAMDGAAGSFRHYTSHLLPLLGNLPTNNSSLEYLVSLGCLVQTPLGRSSFWNLARHSNAASFVPSFTLNEFKSAVNSLSDDECDWLLVPELGRQTNEISCAGKYTLAFPNKESLGRLLAEHSAKRLENEIIAFIDTRCPDENAIRDILIAEVPQLGPFSDIWDSAHMGAYSPTALGLTVAHSNAVRLWQSFRAPLSIWVS